MRFSQVIGECYHRISLPKRQRDRLDTFFTGSAHHLYRFKAARRGSPEEAFHDFLFRAHLLELMRVIYDHGDFALAIDPTGRGLHIRSRWNPIHVDRLGLPDPTMFNSMAPDARYGLGEHHPNDLHLPKSCYCKQAA